MNFLSYKAVKCTQDEFITAIKIEDLSDRKLLHKLIVQFTSYFD